MKTKDQTLYEFQRFKTREENSSGLKLLMLRSDNGGEYTSDAFKNYCSIQGIHHEYTQPFIPQSNGTAER